jgi:hypothetical protein
MLEQKSTPLNESQISMLLSFSLSCPAPAQAYVTCVMKGKVPLLYQEAGNVFGFTKIWSI